VLFSHDKNPVFGDRFCLGGVKHLANAGLLQREREICLRLWCTGELCFRVFVDEDLMG
jgi:hypothetical protein